MQSITIKISKGFGKAITLELPQGQKHIITQSTNAYLYNDLAGLINLYNKAEKACRVDSTLLLPDDYDFGDDDQIPLENIID